MKNDVFKMSDAAVEGPVQDGAGVGQQVNIAEIMRQAEGEGRQFEAAAAAAAVGHFLVAGGAG